MNPFTSMTSTLTRRPWLALVEPLPAGTEGSPVERNLVRNELSRIWNGRKQLLKDEQRRFFETRSSSLQGYCSDCLMPDAQAPRISHRARAIASGFLWAA
ncbi:MAG: hypothetical protein I8H70_01715 [Burkholderiales bacterium]|nr:hypothetical protein [Burkholderiales bacterium]